MFRMWEVERSFQLLKFFFWLIMIIAAILFLIAETNIADNIRDAVITDQPQAGSTVDFTTTVKAYEGVDIRRFALPDGTIARVKIKVEK